MREIKFRAVCDADDKIGMLYFGMKQFDNGIASWPLPDDIAHIDEYMSPLMQFTGLKDVNGKDIYEGDIIDFDFDGVIFVSNGYDVLFKEGAFVVNKPNFKPLVSDCSRIRIKGNKFQNPELLNSEAQ